MSPGRRHLAAAADFALVAVMAEIAIPVYTSASPEVLSFLLKITLPFAIVLLFLRGYYCHDGA